MGSFGLQAAIWYASRNNKRASFGPFYTVATHEWLSLCAAHNEYRGIKTN